MSAGGVTHYFRVGFVGKFRAVPAVSGGNNFYNENFAKSIFQSKHLREPYVPQVPLIAVKIIFVVRSLPSSKIVAFAVMEPISIPAVCIFPFFLFHAG